MLQIYKASAGSGKTFTLAKEYIRDLLGIRPKGSDKYLLNLPKYVRAASDTVNRHRFILAITFTNKATEEMKRRIVNELDELTRPPRTLPDGTVKDANYAGLAKDFGCTRQELAEAAQNALQQLLHDYQNFNISTIDSFFQRVLRTFARELDRQGDYAVELEAETALRQSVDKMLDDFNAGTMADTTSAAQLASWIQSFVNAQTDKGRKNNFFNRSSSLYEKLVKSMSKITEEGFKKHYDAMRLYLADHERVPAFGQALEERCRQIMDGLKDSVDSILAPIEAQGFEVEMMGRSVMVKLIRDNVRTCTYPEDFSDRINSLTNISQGLEKRAICKEFKTHPEWRAAVGEAATEMLDAWIKCNELRHLRSGLTQLGMLSFVWDYLDNFTVENNTVLLSDTNHLLSRIIDGSETPFVYERMGVRLRHFLIDEFQDTSGMQWENLRPLVRNSMGEGYDNLIIGDVKQSIYLWRGSKPDLLHRQVQEEDFPIAERNTVLRGDKPEENTNYRSSRDVVEFNNTLFPVLAAQLGSDCYGHVVQQVAKKNADYPGYILFTPVQKGQDGIQTSLHHMAAEMIRQYAAGYDWDEITVLVRRKKDGEAVIDFLMREYPEIPLMSEESLFLHKSPAVQRVVGILKLIEQAGGEPRKADKGHINITPAEVSVVESRYAYLLGRGEDESRALDIATDILSNDCAALAECADRVRRRRPSSLVALVETVIHEELADATDGQIAYLAAFQDLLVDYCSHASPTLSAFLHYWELAKDSATIPAAMSAHSVRVMTVHKAKGLEFKCVHIPFGGWEFPGRISETWLELPKLPGIAPELVPPAIYLAPPATSEKPGSMFHKEYMEILGGNITEGLNTAYVAYTRAEAELIVQYIPGEEWGKYLQKAFENEALKKYLDESGTLTVGAPTVRRADNEEKPLTNIVCGETTMPSYRVSFNAMMNTLTTLSDTLELDSDVADEDVDPQQGLAGKEPDASDYADEASLRRGIVMHDAMSAVDTAADIPRAAMLAARRHGLTDEETGEVRACIEAMLDCGAPEVERWFARGADVVCEQTVFAPREGIMRRPDRVVFLPDGSVEVVDYKFTSVTDPEHESQVREYLRLLRGMGHESVRGYLWYPFLDTPLIKEVPLA